MSGALNLQPINMGDPNGFGAILVGIAAIGHYRILLALLLHTGAGAGPSAAIRDRLRDLMARKERQEAIDFVIDVLSKCGRPSVRILLIGAEMTYVGTPNGERFGATQRLTGETSIYPRAFEVLKYEREQDLELVNTIGWEGYRQHYTLLANETSGAAALELRRKAALTNLAVSAGDRAARDWEGIDHNPCALIFAIGSGTP
jgi:hypothetical protein